MTLHEAKWLNDYCITSKVMDDDFVRIEVIWDDYCVRS
jgi:hypothetical protein